MSFKEQLLLNCLPRTDDMLSIWTEPGELRRPLTWAGSDSAYVLISGVETAAMSDFMAVVKQRGQELMAYYRELLPDGPWDVAVKPVFLFETIDLALEFRGMIGMLDEGDQAEVLSDLQLEYNEPWGEVTVIDFAEWIKIEDRYSPI